MTLHPRVATRLSLPSVPVAAVQRRWARPLLHGLSLAGVLLLVYTYVTVPGPGYDAFAYWHLDLSNLYPAFTGLGSYRYPPPLAQVLWPLGALPWTVFLVGWTALAFAALVATVGRNALACLAFVPVSAELFIGNIHLPMALTTVIGFRWPAAWSFILLTKPTCGVGLLWFAWRREWRSLAIALGTTSLIAAVSFVLAPNLWVEWWSSMMVGASLSAPGIGGPFLPRLVIAAVVVSWGALTDRRWTVPVAVTLALPFLWVHGLAILVAVIPLWRRVAANVPTVHAAGAAADGKACGLTAGAEPV